MYLTDAGLDELEKEAEKIGNANLLLQIQILKELREVKKLLKCIMCL